VSLGSSGQAQLLPMVIDALATLGRPVVVATAGRGGELPKRARVWVADFVSGEAIAKTACAVVCNGGSPTTHQALLAGIPVVGIAHNLDQYLNMHYIGRFGAGTLLRADRLRGEAVRNATRRAMEDSSMQERARAVAAMAKGISTDAEFASAICLLLDKARQPDSKSAF
jgi:UDP:flavonoid glycosyltransferase YjiC (YdhE family)